MKRLLARFLSFLSGRAPKEAPKPTDQTPVPEMALPQISGAMTIDEFWEIIGVVHEVSGGDLDIKEAALRKALESLSAENVVAFATHFDTCEAQAYRWDLWAAAYIIHGGCSDDSFQDFRASLICQGRDRFERVMKNPECLADAEFEGVAEKLDYEGFQYVPTAVYEEKTGESLPPSSVTHPADPAGEEWEEDGLAEKFPKLWKKFDQS